MVNVNAYHQPGVEAGKKASAGFLDLMRHVRGKLVPGKTVAARDLAGSHPDLDAETAYHILAHLAANDSAMSMEEGDGPDRDSFTLSA